MNIRRTFDKFLMKFTIQTIDVPGVAGYTCLSCEKSEVEKTVRTDSPSPRRQGFGIPEGFKSGGGD